MLGGGGVVVVFVVVFLFFIVYIISFLQKKWKEFNSTKFLGVLCVFT